ncbi:MAG: hypothetical protein AB9836_02600 [Aminipila sp.]
MDIDELVAQIAAKVSERISQLEAGSELQALNGSGPQKPKALILSEDHGTCCHSFLESKCLKEYFEMVCALNENYQCKIEQFEVIVLPNVNNTALGKITEGIGDTDFTATVIKAILLGKQILILNEGIELFQYKDTAPKLYYGMMMQKLELLKNVGIQFCNANELENMLLKKESHQEKKSGVISQRSEVEVACDNNCEHTVNLTKRIITEQDIRSVHEKHATQICITGKTIITDLAHEYAEQKGISFIIS